MKNLISRLEHLDMFFLAAMQKLCAQMIDSLVANTPGTTFPTLWKQSVSKNGNTIQGSVWNTRIGSDDVAGSDPGFLQIAIWLNDGTDAHWIYPVNVKALHWEEDGQHFFSKGHKVSGITASHFVEKVDRIIADYEATLDHKLQAYIEQGRMP